MKKDKQLYRSVRKISKCNYYLRPITLSACLPVCSPIRMEKLDSNSTDFLEIWYQIIFRKSVEEIQVSQHSDKKNGHFTWIP
jgi:hypothetical protein